MSTLKTKNVAASVVKPAVAVKDLASLKSEAKNYPDTLVIPLDEGRITGKSRFNLQDFMFKMNSNLKHVLFSHVLKTLGITIYENELYDAGATKARTEYETWLENKAKFESAQMGQKTAVAKQD